jgi:beta,beta-carotene 9',10'-dioxygenase
MASLPTHNQSIMDQAIIDNEEEVVPSNEEFEESESESESESSGHDHDEKDSLLRQTEHHAAQPSPLRFLQFILSLGSWSPSHGLLKRIFLLGLLIIVYLANGSHLQLQQLENNKNTTDATHAAPPPLCWEDEVFDISRYHNKENQLNATHLEKPTAAWGTLRRREYMENASKTLLSPLCFGSYCTAASNNPPRLKMPNAALLYKTNLNDVTETPIELSGSGRLPSWLVGDFLQTGFRGFESQNNKLDFLFDCFSGLHRLHLNGATQQGTYTASLLKSNYYNASKTTGTIPSSITFGGTSPPTSLTYPQMMKLMVSGEGLLMDNLNVAMAQFDDQLVLLSDTNKMVEFDMKSLAYRKVQDWNKDTFSGLFDIMSSAHPVPHPSLPGKINYVVAIDVPLMRRHKYRFFHIPNTAPGTQRKWIGDIVSDRVAYVHSFATTSNYIIFFEFPMFLKIMSMVKAGGPLHKSMEWLPERGTKVTVMSITTGQILQTFRLDAMFAYHHINAYEEKDNIVVDLAAYNDSSHLSTFDLNILRTNPTDYFPCSQITRVSLFLSTFSDIQPTTTVISPMTCLDLTSVNPIYVQQPYKFVYGVAQYSRGDMWNTLVKINTQLEQENKWAEEDCYPGEPQFVPRPSATSEDDGVVLSIVLSGIKAQSFLLVLDGKTFKEIARIWLPDRTTYLSHGLFVPSK